jgi:hypothetical protein
MQEETMAQKRGGRRGKEDKAGKNVQGLLKTPMAQATKKIRIVVKSRLIPFSIREFVMPITGPFGKLYSTSRRVIVYERVLDEAQTTMVEEARKFSTLSGLELEVIDLGRKNFVSRLVRKLGERLNNKPTITGILRQC